MMNYIDIIKNGFLKSATNIQKMAGDDKFIAQVSAVASVIINSYRNGGRLYLCGNGGSAADAQHWAAEMVSKLSRDRTPIPASAFTVDTSLLTAIGNDYGYENSFSRQVLGFVRQNDILVAISTSGNSPNILKALKACKSVGGTSILLTGREGGAAVNENLADYSLIVPGATTDSIQECHLIVYHMLCYLIEIGLVESGHTKYI